MTQTSKTLKALRQQVHTAMAPTYFSSLSEALGILRDVLTANGLSAECLDGIWTGRDGRAVCELAGLPSNLVVTWHRMESGRMEVVAYVS